MKALFPVYLFIMLVINSWEIASGQNKFPPPGEFASPQITKMVCFAGIDTPTDDLENDGIFFSSILPFISVFILLLLIYLTYERIILLKASRNEKASIRNRIARDLHDDLASTLSSTQIYTEVLKHSETINSQQYQLIDKISTLLKESSEAMSDIIWDISPMHDKVDDLFMKLKTMTMETCSSNSIKLNITEDCEDCKRDIPENVRRNIFLIYKESLTNIIKHASTEKVNAEFYAKGKSIKIVLEDFGKGMFSEEVYGDNLEIIKAKPGFKLYRNGISNLFQRTSEIGGRLEITSVPLKGTRLVLTLKIT